MKTTLFFALVCVLTGLLLMPAQLFAQHDPVGSWEYAAPDAPYEYSAGKMMFSREKNELKGVLVIGSYELVLFDVKQAGAQLLASAYVEGQQIDIEVTLDKNTFSGKASYPEASIPITGKRLP